MRRFLVWVLTLITAGYTYLDYWNLSRISYAGNDWADLLAGHGLAPAQYRIGVLRAASLLASITHTHLRHMFAAIDCVSLAVALTLLFLLILRSRSFRTAPRTGQWLQAAMALGVSLLYLQWTFWYQKPETQATLVLLVLSAFVTQWRRRVAACLVLVLVAAAAATVRADAIVAFHAGFLVCCVLPRSGSGTPSHGMPLGRAAQAVASALSLVAACAVEYWIIHSLYPHVPRQNDAFQLLNNLIPIENYVALACALFPWWVTLALAARRWRALNGWAIAMLLGSVFQFALFYTLGLAVEVRIMLPFAMTVLPLTAALGYAAITGRPASEPID